MMITAAVAADDWRTTQALDSDDRRPHGLSVPHVLARTAAHGIMGRGRMRGIRRSVDST
jgi:hypothetical protein